MKDFSFSLFPNENFLDLRLYQYGSGDRAVTAFAYIADRQSCRDW